MRKKTSLELALEHVSVVGKMCRIWGGMVTAHNGTLSAGYPVPDTLECYVNIAALKKALNKCKGIPSITVAGDGVALQVGDEYVALDREMRLPACYPNLPTACLGEAGSHAHRAAYGVNAEVALPLVFQIVQSKIKTPAVATGQIANWFTLWFENDSWLKTTLDGPEFVIPKVAKECNLSSEDPFTVEYSSVQRTFVPPIWENATLICDVECYPNYFLVAFKNVDTGEYAIWELSQPVHVLHDILTRNRIVTFNGINYDIPMIVSAIRNPSHKYLYGISKRLISDELWFKVVRDIPVLDHVDVMNVAPLTGGLKLYAARLNAKRIQDLPYDPEKKLLPNEIETVRDYCCNDLDNTQLLMEKLIPQLTLRYDLGEQYGLNLMSKSDAQIAEAVISSELFMLNGIKTEPQQLGFGYTYRYVAPKYLQFSDGNLNRLVDKIEAHLFGLTESGGPDAGDLFNETVWIANREYRMGIGGLHSCEESVTYNCPLTDRDVTSYYPAIIVNQGLYPEALGKGFLDVYTSLIDQRISAKKCGDKIKAESLKITVNGTFGKLGSKYSKMYSPSLLTQVTITGQLSLLMLIEMLTDAGCTVVSANTDGVVYWGDADETATRWEQLTGFNTECTQYTSIHLRDVNNYFAVKTDGTLKRKGCFTDAGMSRNPEYQICNDAAIAYISKGVPVETTIRDCTDIARFVAVRNVRGGAVKSSVYLGKTVRWYWSTEMKDAIYYKESHNKVPNSDGARPLMELGDFPNDIDYKRYCDRAKSLLVDVGYDNLI